MTAARTTDVIQPSRSSAEGFNMITRDIEQVKELREKTGAGVLECKKALAETQGDLAKAVEHLRKKGMASAEKKSGRSTREGLIGTYIHAGDKLGVLIEVNCETDFVARTEEFRGLVKELAMHVAAADPSPRYIQQQDVPKEIVDKERQIYLAQAKESGKPEKAWDKIVEGKLAKFLSEVCLLEQPFIKDQDTTVKQLLVQKIAQLGENITIRRFTRYRVGEEQET
jgi:elongation factor Ts